ncbi:hypothetical protein [Pedobacter deserti]|uniref:hypothetical protein n=1 Tax=Pedobacter deserti TaxID=2817382 RepID=UPI002109A356|nr:hypothetical protein [Pedobacter sp. SYSU D00382]
MKNLNINSGNVRKLGFHRIVNKKWLYSLCAVAVLLTSSLTSIAQTDASTAVDFGTFSLSGRDRDGMSVYTTDYACINNYGMDGNDYWIKITVTDPCYILVHHGSTSGYGIYDSVIHLLDSNGYLMTSGDDDRVPLSDFRAVIINYYVYPGDYYVVVDGTSSKGHDKDGGMGLGVRVSADPI